MRRVKPEDSSAAGQDSFLDVVTNIVGIIIILVMVVGAKVQHIILSGTPKSGTVDPQRERDVADLAYTAAVAESEIGELSKQALTVAEAAVQASEARLQMATIVSAARRELDEISKKVDERKVLSAQALDQKKQIQNEIAQHRSEKEQLASMPAETKQVLEFPTPISRVVTGEEIHFRLAEGRVAYIPIEELFELAKTRTRRSSDSLSKVATRVETVGPVQSFALDYCIETSVDPSRGQVLVRSREWVVRPTGSQIGETLEEALAKGSRFQGIIERHSSNATVTLWCYPDSFETFRAIRENLYARGMPTAGRPMPDGAPIGGSTEGSKSVVQ